MDEIEYSVIFYLPVDGERHMVETIIPDGGVTAIQNGFWINDDMDFTKASDCVYWVAPSQILGVKREVENETLD